jgi:hypothetical protein
MLINEVSVYRDELDSHNVTKQCLNPKWEMCPYLVFHSASNTVTSSGGNLSRKINKF